MLQRKSKAGDTGLQRDEEMHWRDTLQKKHLNIETDTNVEIKIWVHKHQNKTLLQRDERFYGAIKSHEVTITHQEWKKNTEIKHHS